MLINMFPHTYQMDEFISNFRAVCCICIQIFNKHFDITVFMRRLIWIFSDTEQKRTENNFFDEYTALATTRDKRIHNMMQKIDIVH